MVGKINDRDSVLNFVLKHKKATLIKVITTQVIHTVIYSDWNSGHRHAAIFFMNKPLVL